jgi:hypothetical protein
MAKYSKVYKKHDKLFRYDYTNCTLELIQTHDWNVDDNDNEITFKLDEARVLDAYGLSLENWQNSKDWWIDTFNDEIEEALHFMAML